MKFSEILKKEREQKGLTQLELASRLGFSKSRISMYENGRREPNLDDLDAISDFFNVQTDYLLGKTTVRRSVWYDEFGSEYIPSTLNDKKNYYYDDETAALAKELHNNPRLRVLMSSSRKTTPEELEALIKIVEGMTHDD